MYTDAITAINKSVSKEVVATTTEDRPTTMPVKLGNTCVLSQFTVEDTDSRFGRMSGSMKTPNGSVSVGYVNDGEKVCFKICIPEGVKAVFRFGDTEKALICGENEVVCNV